MRVRLFALLCAIVCAAGAMFSSSAEGVPAPARELSFLSEYADAMQVGDWYLACTGASGKGHYYEATRNETSNWRLLDGAGEVLADGLLWWPPGDAWPLMPRPFEGFVDGVNTAVIRVGSKYGLIDRSGRIVVEPKYDSIFGFLPGDTSTPVELNGLWGCIDEAGHEIVPPRYDESFARFHGGCTVISHKGKYGLLGEDGAELMPPVYGDMWLDDGSEVGFARRKGVCSLFNRRGEILLETELKNGYIYCYADARPPYMFNDGERSGYMLPDGTRVIPAVFDGASPFWEGNEVAAVCLEGKWGLVRADGSYAVEPRYDELGGISEGLIWARMGEKWGYIDENGATVIPFEFGAVGRFLNGFADARSEAEGKHGLIDRTGAWVVPPEYEGQVGVGEDGVAVAARWEPYRFFRVTERGAEPIGGLSEWTDTEGCYPNEDASALAALDGSPTLSRRVSDEARLPHLDGARRLYPLYAAFVQAVYPKKTKFEAWNSYVHDGNPILTYNEAEDAWDRLSEGDADVIFVPAPDMEDPVWATLAARGQEPEFIPLCRDALVFLVCADNPVQGVTQEQLAKVYAGEISDWSALGAAGLGEIVAYQSYEYSDAREIFDRLSPFEASADAPEGITGWDEWGGDLSTGPVSFRGLPGALGYASRAECRKLLEAGAVKLLSVDGVAPDDANIARGEYPWVETLYAVRLKGNDNPNVSVFWDWIRSEQGAELIGKTGYVPCAPAA